MGPLPKPLKEDDKKRLAEQIMAEPSFVEGIWHGLADLRAGRVIPWNKAKKRLRRRNETR